MIDNLRQCQSEAIFGSKARQDTDLLSDNDYLIVDDHPVVLMSRRLHLEVAGWSVSSYSWRRLRRLVEQKALFAQHLKIEALVVKDDFDCLKHLLSQYSPSVAYNSDIDAAGAAIYAAIEGDIPLGTGRWIFDVLAVNIRNLAILALANHGEYFFSYEKAIRRLALVYGLSNTDVQNILALREIKAQYRNYHYSIRPLNRITDGILASAQRCMERLGCSFQTTVGTRGYFNYPGVSDLYLKSRLIERDVLRCIPLNSADLEEYRHLVKKILRKSKKPRDYLWQFEHHDGTALEIATLSKISAPLNKAYLRRLNYPCKEQRTCAIELPHAGFLTRRSGHNAIIV